MFDYFLCFFALRQNIHKYSSYFSLYYACRASVTLQIEIVQGEVDLELVKEREKALQQLEVKFELLHVYCSYNTFETITIWA